MRTFRAILLRNYIFLFIWEKYTKEKNPPKIHTFWVNVLTVSTQSFVITYENCGGFICKILPRKERGAEMEKRKKMGEKTCREFVLFQRIALGRKKKKQKKGLVPTLIYKAVYFKMGLRLTELEKARLFIYICIKMRKPWNGIFCATKDYKLV